MNCSFYRIHVCFPTFHEMVENASAAAESVVRSSRIIELCEQTSIEGWALIGKVQKVFDESKGLLIFAAVTAVAAYLNPAPFFGAMAVGFAGHTIIECMYRSPATVRSIFLEKTHEMIVAQSTLVSVGLFCKAIQIANSSSLFASLKEGPVSAMFAGVIAGAVVSALARRVSMIVLQRIGVLAP